ncbi:NTP transferase domain-containing protein [Candidatus Fermentibacteria bacterium]|nr:NTP transferase domain-containing protein [Candidatus Fermentibacteria bacterium]
MRSDLPKVMHPLLGKPMLEYVLMAARLARAAPVVVITGAATPGVAECARGFGAEIAVQLVPRGTGDAVRWAHPHLNGFQGDIVVLCGDAPVVTGETITRLVALHRGERNAVTILTAQVPNPQGFGRIIRAEDGRVTRIVEEADASAHERAIGEVNSGAYCFAPDALFPQLDFLTSDNSQGEIYLTDVVGALFREGRRVGALSMGVPAAPLGINTVEELEETERVLAARRG